MPRDAVTRLPNIKNLKCFKEIRVLRAGFRDRNAGNFISSNTKFIGIMQ